MFIKCFQLLGSTFTLIINSWEMHPAWGRKEWTASGKFKCMCVIEVSRMGFVPTLYMRIQRDKLHWLLWQTVTREKAFYPHLWEAWLHFQFALYRFAAVGLHLGRWLLHAWKHKWGTGKENLSYVWEKNASSLAAGPAGKLGIEDFSLFYKK